MTEPTVFVLDDSASVRDGLAALIEAAGLSVKTFESAKAFWAAFDPSRAGCLVLDVRLGESSGLDVLDELSKRGLPLPVIVITAYGSVSTAVRAMQSGAFDFLEKPFAPPDLLARIHAGLARAQKLRDEEAERMAIDGGMERLTSREKEVLGLSLAGRTARQIAEILNLSVRTVEVHRHHILGKMNGLTVERLRERLKPVPPSRIG